jgi:hypothetical protein
MCIVLQPQISRRTIILENGNGTFAWMSEETEHIAVLNMRPILSRTLQLELQEQQTREWYQMSEMERDVGCCI